MSWLIDTNVLSELRKGSRADNHVRAWFDATAEAELFTSVLVLGEIRECARPDPDDRRASRRDGDRSRPRVSDSQYGRYQPHRRSIPQSVRRQFIRPMIPLLTLRAWMGLGQIPSLALRAFMGRALNALAPSVA